MTDLIFPTAERAKVLEALAPFAILLKQVSEQGNSDAKRADCVVCISDMRRAHEAIALLQSLKPAAQVAAPEGGPSTRAGVAGIFYKDWVGLKSWQQWRKYCELQSRCEARIVHPVPVSGEGVQGSMGAVVVDSSTLVGEGTPPDRSAA